MSDNTIAPNRNYMFAVYRVDNPEKCIGSWYGPNGEKYARDYVNKEGVFPQSYFQFQKERQSDKPSDFFIKVVDIQQQTIEDLRLYRNYLKDAERQVEYYKKEVEYFSDRIHPDVLPDQFIRFKDKLSKKRKEK